MSEISNRNPKASFKLRLLAIGMLLLIIDQVSKYLTFYHLPLSYHLYDGFPYGGIGIFHQFLGIDFSLAHVANKGAAWGAFSEHQDALNVFRTVIIAMLLYYTFFRQKPYLYHYPLVLICFGAIGNVLDYFIYSYVVDMLKFVFWGYHYPVFNVADSCIFVGVFWFFALSFSTKEKNT